MYANGRGVIRDEAVAVKWFRKAAEQDVFDALLNCRRIQRPRAHGVGCPHRVSRRR